MKLETDKQKLFDTAVRTLHAQGGPAFNDGLCEYRTKEGRRCGVGALLPDDLIDQVIVSGYNGAGIGQLLSHLSGNREANPLKEWLPLEPFLRILQLTHDCALQNSDRMWTDAWDKDHGIASNFWQLALQNELDASSVVECWGPRF